MGAKGAKKKGWWHETDEIDQLSAVSGNIKGYTNVVVNVGDAAHDEERGLGEGVRSDLASLKGVRLVYRNGGTIQRTRSSQRKGNDPIHLHTSA